MSRSQTLKGGPELINFLDQLPARLVRNTLRGGVRAGAKPIAKKAKQLAAKKSGLMAKSIKIDTSVKEGIVKATIRTRGPHAFLAPMFERGIAPHFISVAEDQTPVAKTRRGPRPWSIGTINKAVKRGSLVINGNFVGDTVHHPGVRPMPFMGPAADSEAQAAVTEFGRYIAARLKFGNLDAPVIEVDDE